MRLKRVKRWIISRSPIIDGLLLFAAIPCSTVFLAVRRFGLHRLPMTRKFLLIIGVMPIRRHYFEPLFHPDDLLRPLDTARDLAIDWNDQKQLELLGSFHYQDELLALSKTSLSPYEFCYDNGSFLAGDADYFYSFIREKKPRKIIEIGSGNSTLLARIAIAKNSLEDPKYHCQYTCIEPYEFKWLEMFQDLRVIRERVEVVGLDLFQSLGSGDLLFIDSTHVIRPQGDVVFELLELLPKLASGVFIHFHDIFSPRDYPQDWVLEKILFWNEQYMLEALLTNSKSYKVVGALNYLCHKFPAEMEAVLPIFAREKKIRDPGSFYIQKN